MTEAFGPVVGRPLALWRVGTALAAEQTALAAQLAPSKEEQKRCARDVRGVAFCTPPPQSRQCDCCCLQEGRAAVRDMT